MDGERVCVSVCVCVYLCLSVCVSASQLTLSSFFLSFLALVALCAEERQRHNAGLLNRDRFGGGCARGCLPNQPVR